MTESLKRPRVLLVEDEDATQKALRGWLSYEYDVVVASDGLEGLNAAKAMDPPPDVVLSDVWMPRLDGIEMAERIRREPSLRKVPIIFLTGQTSPKSMVAAISAGARSYLMKPVDLDVLDRKLRSALRGSVFPRPTNST
jgi:DNA-binding response OmpR family regulator